MSELNSNSYSSDSDKCPNCGAMKVFSALVCPVCGMSYSEASDIRKANASAPRNFYKDSSSEEQTERENSAKAEFDPNAALARFKRSLNEAGENPEEDGITYKDSDKKSDDIQVIQEENGRQSVMDAEESAARPENSPLNSGLYGERKYRVGNDISQPSAMPMFDQRTTPAVDQTVVPTRYGLDSEAVRQKREQSLSDESGKQKMFSNTVSQRYEQYKNDMDNMDSQPPYSSPYNRGSFDTVPEQKPNVWAKILPLVAILILVVVVGVFIAKYINRDKNEKGISYEQGTFTSSEYDNKWAEIRFKFDDKMQKAPSLLYTYANAVYNNLPEGDGSLELILYAVYNDTPAVVMMAFSDGSLFGMEEKDFADSDQLDKMMAEGEGSFRVEPDIMLGSHAYKAVSSETEYENGKKMRMYMCYRKIGNRINVVFLYDIPGIVDLNTIKKYFLAY